MRTVLLAPALAALALTACSHDEHHPAAAPRSLPLPTACDARPTTISFTTDDGETLVADLAPTGTVGGPAAILFHMHPPNNTRKNYPPAFVQALTARGISVLNVDRRGAGDSTGNPEEAYQGPKGVLDVAAAVRALAALPCKYAPAKIALVGASNRSTSILDYVATAPPPAAVAFLTPGDYTENQRKLASVRERLAQTPVLFVYSTDEAAWSKAQQPGAPAAWTFKEYAHGEHGTNMFAAVPASVAETADWLAAALK